MKRAIDRFQQRLVFGVVETAASEHGFDAFDPRIGEENVSMLGVGLEVPVRNQDSDNRGQTVGVPGRPVFRPGNHEGNAGLVDENGIGFIYQRKVETAVDERVAVVGDLIAKGIETGLLGGRSSGQLSPFSSPRCRHNLRGFNYQRPCRMPLMAATVAQCRTLIVMGVL